MASFTVNDKIGRYIIKERIGRGGMAEVYRAFDTNLDREVAIKVMYAYLSDDPTFKERFEREAKFVASFNHPHIVKVYDFDSIEIGGERVYYMVMPYLPGKTLREVVQECSANKTSLSLKQAYEITRDIAGALGYAHQRGMVHRDIKPANIMFDENGHVILTDFGIARLIAGSNLTQEGLTVGTPAYMSPEQAAGEGVDARSDLYSLGVILFELLAGRPPFEDEGSLSVILKHLNDLPPSITQFINDTAASEIDSVVQRVLAKEAQDRFQDADEFINAMSAAFGNSLTGDRGMLPVSRVSAPLMQTTQAMNEPRSGSGTRAFTTQLTRQIQTAVRSPVGILIIGVIIIAVFVVLGMFARQPNSVSATATPEPDANVGSMTGNFYFVSTFAPDNRNNDLWPVDSSELITREFTGDGLYRFTNNRPSTAITTIVAPEYGYDNVTLFIKAKLEEGSADASGYGIVFRYVDENNYNVFAVDGQGRFSIWTRKDGVWRELRNEAENWTPNENILKIGEFNSLMLDNFQNMFVGYVNNYKVVEVTLEDAVPVGAVGVYLASTPGGTASVLIDSFSVVELTPAMTEAGN